MGERYLPGFRAVTAPGQSGLGRGMMRFPERWAHDQAAVFQQTGDGVDHSDLQRGAGVQIGQQPRQPRGEHRLARARRANQQDIMTTRGGDFDRAAGGFHAADVAHVGAAAGIGNAAGLGRAQDLGAAEMIDQRFQIGRRQHVQRPGPCGFRSLTHRAYQALVLGCRGDCRGQHARDIVQ